MSARATTSVGIRHNFTVVLSDDEARKILAIIGPFGGSVGGFASSVIRDFLDLTPDQISAFRVQLREMGEANKEEKRLAALGVRKTT